MRNSAGGFDQIADVLVDVTATEFRDKAKELSLPKRTGYLYDHIEVEFVDLGKRRIVSEAGYSGFLEFGHLTRNHAWFVPGRFFFTGALAYCQSFLQQSGVDIIKASMSDWIEPESEDVY